MTKILSSSLEYFIASFSRLFIDWICASSSSCAAINSSSLTISFLYLPQLCFFVRSLKWSFPSSMLSTSIYDIVLLDVCHFHHHHHHLLIFPQIRPLSRYSCLHLGSCIPEIFSLKCSTSKILQNYSEDSNLSWHLKKVNLFDKYRNFIWRTLPS